MQEGDEKKSDQVKLLDTLFASCAKLEENTASLTLEQVQKLSEETDSLQAYIDKKIAGHHRPYIRIFSRMRMFSQYFKIRKLRAKITRLHELAHFLKKQAAIEKIIWQLQRKGFISPMDLGQIFAAYKELIPYVQALENVNVFTLRICDRQEGRLECIHLEKNSQSVFTIILNEDHRVTVVDHNAHFETIDQFLLAYTHNAIPLSQLQDVAFWLEAHGFEKNGAVHHLMSCTVEEKLSKLMQSCPNGAYILYPGTKGSLQLSRLLKRGEICHMTIDLQKAKGCYTFMLPNSSYSASRIEFKKKLEQMGSPVKIKG